MIRAVDVLDVGAEHGEGVIWDAAAQRLRFVDITTCRVLELDPSTGAVTAVTLDRHVTDVHPTDDGRLLVATREGIALLDEVAPGAGVPQVIAAPLAEQPGARMNDGHVDPLGRYFVGSMRYDLAPGGGTLFRLGPDHDVEVVLTAVGISNGIDWSPDGTRVYYVDSLTQRIDVLDYDVETATMSARRSLARIDPAGGVPDGLTVDAAGNVWVALYNGGAVLGIDPSGTVQERVDVPGARLVTSCSFGGPGLTDLFITTSTENLTPADLVDQPAAGHLFRATPGVAGRPAVPVRL